MSARYVLIDFNHLAHRCMMIDPLTTTVALNGVPTVVDTTIPTTTIKNVYNYGGRGANYTAVCLEGGNNARKKYFAENSPTGEATAYKDGRKKNSRLLSGLNLAVELMHEGNVSLYRQEGFEADDCIYSLVQKIKSIDTTTPIDIITNDADMLPLVDYQVSVYMRGSRQFAKEGCPEHRLYYQVTPDTWEDYLSYTSAYKNFTIPYNSMLLFKLIRGDKSDNIPPSVKGFGGVKYSNLMHQMTYDGVDFDDVFRYGVDFDEVLLPVLKEYFPDEKVLNHMRFIYNGINLRYTNLVPPKQIQAGLLQSSLLKLNINLGVR